MDQAEVEAKARDLMGTVLGRKRTETLIGAIRGLAEVKTMARLRPLWQAATPRAGTGTKTGGSH
jgi:hypothetical protein